MAAPKTEILVEVVYALPGAADAVRLALAAGTTLGEAIAAAGMLERHPEIDLQRWQVGIHGKRAGMQTVLAYGDRVEIYRPLLVDPKEARRRRARRS
jgi:uncharacterized protein